MVDLTFDDTHVLNAWNIMGFHGPKMVELGTWQEVRAGSRILLTSNRVSKTNEET